MQFCDGLTIVAVLGRLLDDGNASHRTNGGDTGYEVRGDVPVAPHEAWG